MLASQHASRQIFVHDLLRFIERFLNQGVVGGEKLYRHAFDPDAFFLLFGIAAGAQRIIQRSERKQTTRCLRQNNKDIEIEGQERFRIERRGHCAADGVTREDTVLFKLIEHLKCSPHRRMLQGLTGKRTRLAVTNSSKRPVTDAKATAGLSKSSRLALGGASFTAGGTEIVECV